MACFVAIETDSLRFQVLSPGARWFDGVLGLLEEVLIELDLNLARNGQREGSIPS